MDVMKILAIFVNMSEVKSTVIHRVVVHCGFFSTSSRSYVPSSRSERSDNDDASSFNSEYIDEGRAKVLVLSGRSVLLSL